MKIIFILIFLFFTQFALGSLNNNNIINEDDSISQGFNNFEIIEINQYDKQNDDFIKPSSSDHIIEGNAYKDSVGIGSIFNPINPNLLSQKTLKWHFKTSQFLYDTCNSNEMKNLTTDERNPLLINITISGNAAGKDFEESIEMKNFFWSGIFSYPISQQFYWGIDFFADRIIGDTFLKGFFLARYALHQERLPVDQFIENVIKSSPNNSLRGNIITPSKWSEVLQKDFTQYVVKSKLTREMLSKSGSVFYILRKIEKNPDYPTQFYNKRRTYSHYALQKDEREGYIQYSSFLNRIVNTFDDKTHGNFIKKSFSQPEKIKEVVQAAKHADNFLKKLQEYRERIKEERDDIKRTNLGKEFKDIKENFIESNKNFTKFFHQSEQAFLTYSLKEVGEGNELESIIKQLKDRLRKEHGISFYQENVKSRVFKGEISSIVINIASYRHICKYCRSSLSYSFSDLQDKIKKELEDRNGEAEELHFQMPHFKIHISSRGHSNMVN